MALLMWSAARQRRLVEIDTDADRWKGSTNLVLGHPQGMVGLGSRWRDLAYVSEGSHMPGTTLED